MLFRTCNLSKGWLVAVETLDTKGNWRITGHQHILWVDAARTGQNCMHWTRLDVAPLTDYSGRVPVCIRHSQQRRSCHHHAKMYVRTQGIIEAMLRNPGLARSWLAMNLETGRVSRIALESHLSVVSG